MNTQWMDPHLRLALLKESYPYRSYWLQYRKSILLAIEKINQFANDPAKKCNETDGHSRAICKKKCIISKYCHESSKFLLDLGNEFEFVAFEFLEKILPTLDPFNKEELPEDLYIVFTDRLPPITQVHLKENSPREFRHGTFWKEGKSYLNPHQRMFIIDLTRRKGEILDCFEGYLNLVEELRDEAELFPEVNDPLFKNYAKWKPERNRKRDTETWTALKVWQLARNNKSFPEISRETGLKIETARKAFWRIFKLLEKDKHSKRVFNKKYAEIIKEDLKIICDTCPQKKSCSTVCPDIMKYADQDKIKLDEKILKNPVDEIMESYDPENQEITSNRKILYGSSKEK